MMKKTIFSLLLVMIIVLSGCATLKNQFGTGLENCPAGIGEEALLADSANADVTGDSVVDVEDTTEDVADTTEDADVVEEDVEEPVVDEPVETVEEPVVKETTEGFELTEEEKALPQKQVKEGELISFPNLKATDPDGDEITYTFTAPLDANGEWLTKEGDAGKYVATITASDGVNSVEQKVLLLVEVANHAPVIKLLDKITIKEGDSIELKPEVSDADGDTVDISYSGWKDTNKVQTGFEDAGDYEIIVSATDRKATTTAKITITVENVNRAPALETLDSFEVTEEEKFKLVPSATDPDGDDVEFTFSEPLDENGEWTPKVGDAGNYKLKVSATDGTDKTEESFFLIVVAKNMPPVLKIADVTVEEGETVELAPEATDPEGEEVTITYSGWMNTNTKETGFEDAGEYAVTVKASDGERESFKEITVTVLDKNRAPVFGENAFE